MSCSRMVLESSSDMYRKLQSLWRIHPLGLPLLARATLSASSANSAVMLGPIAQPTIRLEHMSITSARYSQSWLHLLGQFRKNQTCFPELDQGNVAQSQMQPETAAPMRVVPQLDPQLAGRAEHLA